MRSREAALQVRHDLGKYVYLEARWLGEDSSEVDVREALITDLRRTRRGPSGDESCVAVWTRLRPSVAEFDTAEVDWLVSHIADLLGELDAMALLELRAVARVSHKLAEACRRLVEQSES